MKLAISNLAWDRAEDSAVADLMGALCISGLEIAPTRVWADPLAVSQAQARDYRARWEGSDVKVVALQSLLFGKSELSIFESATRRAATRAYLAAIFRLGGWLGAEVAVFGSPKNRRVGGVRTEEAAAIAIEFFRGAGEDASDCGMTLCIEPSPAEYGCDFITTSREGDDLVSSVGADGFGLHLDAAGMTLAGEEPQMAIPALRNRLRHFHASEPDLAELGTAGTNHARFANALRESRYEGWVSVEMGAGERGENVRRVESALRLATRLYGPDPDLRTLEASPLTVSS